MLKNHGYSDVDWDDAKKETTSILIDIARKKGRIAYSELADQIQSIEIEAHDPRMFRMLDEISTEEDQAGRGMLSAIVVHKYGDMKPGHGFFKLAKSLGKDTTNILDCWICEFKRVHDYWANRAKNT